jgi:hypothetical protein
MRVNRRAYTRGDLLTIHLVDNSTVRGSFERETRRNLILTRYEIEAGGVLHEMKGDRLIVPKPVKLVEVSER